MSDQCIKKFITYKEPDCSDGKILFRTHVVMSDGQHLLISDSRQPNDVYSIDETLVFCCNEAGKISSWVEVQGARNHRTDDVIKMLNNEGYRKVEINCEFVK